jgi:ubiquinone biosynthesis protein
VTVHLVADLARVAAGPPGSRRPPCEADELAQHCGDRGAPRDARRRSAGEVTSMLGSLAAGLGGWLHPRALRDLLTVMERRGHAVPRVHPHCPRSDHLGRHAARHRSGFNLATSATEQFTSRPQDGGGDPAVAQRELLRALPSLRTLPASPRTSPCRCGRGSSAWTPRRSALRVAPPWPRGSTRCWRGHRRRRAARVGAPARRRGVADPHPGTTALIAIGWIGLVLATVMLMRVVAQIVRRKSTTETDERRGA